MTDLEKGLFCYFLVNSCQCLGWLIVKASLPNLYLNQLFPIHALKKIEMSLDLDAKGTLYVATLEYLQWVADLSTFTQA
ncbi:hypothetical protein Marme_0414 [Marinomonas mediterranea MMB-1]|uniref:Uncharacterized protein n=1 Tax=Marinomonas mediterranea (strain ATCC 700492 / JCM 21426 / NBRC 103028 / MMB-1) TaxID=717774 RepID=F2JYT9_MARM1|nr:hypothetical protein Marme_0414 [Marinomonas mediterranea MMB-1]